MSMDQKRLHHLKELERYKLENRKLRLYSFVFGVAWFVQFVAWGIAEFL